MMCSPLNNERIFSIFAMLCLKIYEPPSSDEAADVRLRDLPRNFFPVGRECVGAVCVEGMVAADLEGIKFGCVIEKGE